MVGVVLEIGGVEGFMVLGNEEGRSPPAVESLELVPLGQPLGLKVEKENDLLLEVQLSLVSAVVSEAFPHQDVNICALGHCLQLNRCTPT